MQGAERSEGGGTAPLVNSPVALERITYFDLKCYLLDIVTINDHLSKKGVQTMSFFNFGRPISNIYQPFYKLYY